MNTLKYFKEITAVEHYDVVVCGGGSAGWVAAVSAARQGLKTALIEKQGFLGGTATGGLVIPMSGFYFRGERVVNGIAWEFVKELEALGAARVELPKGHISFHPEQYKLVAQRMVQESGVQTYMNTSLIDCIAEKGRVISAIIANKSGIQVVSADYFIDASGDGDLCDMAGVPMLEKQESLQPVSLCFLLEGVDTDTDLLRDSIRHDGKNGKPSCNQTIRERLQERCKEYENLQFGGPWFNTLHRGKCLAVNMTRNGVDATDAQAFSRAESKLREDMFLLVDILRQEFPEFKDCEIVYSAINAGIRETRHIKGVYTLSLKDIEEPNMSLCPVAHLAHPMDIHSSKNSDQALIQLTKDVYVPYDTMVCNKMQNVIAAGRCISAQKEPYASLRVMGTLMNIGEAAGIAAKIAMKRNCPVADIPRDELKNRILGQEVFLVLKCE